MSSSKRESTSTSSARAKHKTETENEHELQQLSTPSDVEGQFDPPIDENAFGNEEEAEIQYKTCAWW